jgi:hypothetical protein
LAVYDSTWLLARYWSLIESFMEIGVKLFASGVKRFYVVFEKGLEKETMGHLNTRMQFLEVLCVSFAERFRWFFRKGGFRRSFECDCKHVHCFKEVTGKFGDSKISRLLLLSRGIPLQVDKVCLEIPEPSLFPIL